ncbi:MAG: hypothetical protein FWB86_11245, partial [Treponema sp.]|nr:hypothetical protein [Treponema sp.]MCL2252463.1 hypothetical protein [Treponema sp.]
MKRFFILMMIITVTTASVFSENNKQKKHQFLDQYFGVNIGAAGIRTKCYGIFTANLGVNYGFYLHEWVSINTGFMLHTEFYFNHNLL